MKHTYTKEDLQTDEEWLRGLGIETEEVTDFLIQTITAGFKMSKKEYCDFMESLK